MNSSLKHRVFGIAVTAIHFITACVFVIILASTALLTPQLIILLSVVLLAFSAGVLALVWDSRKRAKTVIGTILALLSMAVQILGVYYINAGVSALEEITVPSTEYAEISVFVEQNDPASELTDAKGYTFGILEVLDREATDSAVEKLSKLLKAQIKTVEYPGLGELLDALLNTGEVNAVIFNKSFLDILEDTEGHENDITRLRELYTVKVEPSSSDEEIKQPIVDEPKDYFTVYITGIDGYGGLSRRSRSDVNILATVNTKTGQILLVSTPRDYYVPLSISGGIPDKLTHAGIYGTKVSRDTISLLYDIPIDYYFKVNFQGFKNIIDALGGVTVYSEYAFKTGKYSFTKGDNFMDGETALAFSRERKSLAGGDRQRGKNQMAVIKGVIKKAIGPALLANYSEVLEGVKGSFETDMPYEEISKLVQNQLKNGTSWNIVSYSADGTGASKKPYSLSTRAYVMVPDRTTVDHAKELIRQVQDGEVPTP